MKTILAGAAIAVALLFSSAAHADNLVVNGSFETPGANGYFYIYPNGSVPGWTSNNNELELDYTPIFGAAAYDGSQSAELNGNTYDTITQTINNLIIGQQYTFSWAYGSRVGSGNEAMSVYFGNTLVTTDNSLISNSFVWTPNSYTVTATSASEAIRFATLNVGGSSTMGNELDAVSLVATPEPSSLALLGTGLLGIVGAARRRLS